MEKTDKVKHLIQEKFSSSNGKCGLYIADLQNQTNLPEQELKTILRTLFDEKFFTVREGLNGKMLTMKNK